MQTRQFSEEFRLEAVKLARHGNVPVAQIARDLGIVFFIGGFASMMATANPRLLMDYREMSAASLLDFAVK